MSRTFSFLYTLQIRLYSPSALILTRTYIGRGRVQVAKTVLDMLPAELNAMREPEGRATEYMHYRQFFIVWEALARVTECQALEATQMTKDTRLAWLSDYKVGISFSSVLG